MESQIDAHFHRLPPRLKQPSQREFIEQAETPAIISEPENEQPLTAEILVDEIKQFLQQLSDQDFDALLKMKFVQSPFRKRFKRIFIKPVSEKQSH